MTQLERLQQIRRLVWDLYTAPSFEKEEALTHLCDKAIDAAIYGGERKERAA